MVKTLPMKGKRQEEPFVNSNVMVTDLLEMDDDISRRLVGYFSKNFDVDFDRLREEYKK